MNASNLAATAVTKLRMAQHKATLLEVQNQWLIARRVFGGTGAFDKWLTTEIERAG